MTRSAFHDHLLVDHPELATVMQNSSMIMRFQRSKQEPAGLCPFCSKPSKLLKSHLARHMEQIALYVLGGNNHDDLDTEPGASDDARRNDSSDDGILEDSSNEWDELDKLESYEHPQDQAPLPSPSEGAFRRGDRKADSVAIATGVAAVDDPTEFPQFPTMATVFGPRQTRVLPVRQPRVPPALDELRAKPTTKFEGSKNFATFTRRNAVRNLVRATVEQRGYHHQSQTQETRPLPNEDLMEIS